MRGVKRKGAAVTNNAQLIKSAVTMREVAEMYGIKILRADFICCPLHNERTGSMKLYKTGFKCFSCGKQGDVIDFVKLMEGVDFIQAVAKLNGYFGLGLNTDTPADPQALQRHREAQNAKLLHKQAVQEKIWQVAEVHCNLWHELMAVERYMEALEKEWKGLK